MFENIPKQTPENDKSVSRRNFLKKAVATVVGIDVAGATLKYGQESLVAEEDLREEGSIVDKKYLPPRLGVASGAKLMATTELPEKYTVFVSTSRGIAKISVTKDVFDTYVLGEKVDVRFKRHPLPGETTIDRNGLGIESITKI